MHKNLGGVVRRAFTLIELLVVIAIISLLISMLLPALSCARRSGMAVSCQSKIRQIGIGMISYAGENDDWIVGSPAGSGAHIQGSFASGDTTQRWDFMGPIAKLMGYSLNEDGGNSATIERFNKIRNQDLFQCPSNPYLATWYSGPNAGTGPMISYNTSRNILFRQVDSGGDGIETYDNPYEEHLPKAWSPRIGRIGDSSKKVFCADGSRFATTVNQPDYDLNAQAPWGGTFADLAPYSTFTRSWDRGGISGGAVDARIYSFRHANCAPAQHAPANVFKMNLVFMDGHAQKMGDLEAANPYMWLPAGSDLAPDAMYDDVKRTYGITGTIHIGS